MRRGVLCSVMMAAGCIAHRGPWHTGSPPPSNGVSLVLLGDIGTPSSSGPVIAQRVEQHLAQARPSVVLWLGNQASAPRSSFTARARRRGPHCFDPSLAPSTPTYSALARAVRTHAPSRSFAVHGVRDHRCRFRTSQPTADPLTPWRMPAAHYALRLFDDGSPRVWAQCADGSCTFDRTIDRDPRRPLVDLVMVDLSPWLYPAELSPTWSRDTLSVQALNTLLAALSTSEPNASPPRLLVSHVPVEAGGEHGLGALRPDATVHNLPPRLQSMLVEGHFAGVLAAYDRSMYLGSDLSAALKRADRTWLEQPVFQVAAGSITSPTARSTLAWRRRRVRTSQAWRPEIWSDHAGFAVVDLYPDHARLTLHAHRGSHWEVASTTVALRPAPWPSATPSPPMTPCRDCPPIPATER